MNFPHAKPADDRFVAAHSGFAVIAVVLLAMCSAVGRLTQA